MSEWDITQILGHGKNSLFKIKTNKQNKTSLEKKFSVWGGLASDKGKTKPASPWNQKKKKLLLHVAKETV